MANSKWFESAVVPRLRERIVPSKVFDYDLTAKIINGPPFGCNRKYPANPDATPITRKGNRVK